MRVCRDAEIPLVLFEIPLLQMLKSHLLEDVYPRFMSVTRSMANKYSIPFITLKDLGLEITDEDFREQSHLNYRGAQRLTRALMTKVVTPQLASSMDVAISQ